MQSISDCFEVICRIPVMRSKQEFKAFFDLEIEESSLSRENSMDRASIGGPFTSFGERNLHQRNNTIKHAKSKPLVATQPVQDYMHMQQQVAATVE